MYNLDTIMRLAFIQSNEYSTKLRNLVSDSESHRSLNSNEVKLMEFDTKVETLDMNNTQTTKAISGITQASATYGNDGKSLSVCSCSDKNFESAVIVSNLYLITVVQFPLCKVLVEYKQKLRVLSNKINLFALEIYSSLHFSPHLTMTTTQLRHSW